MKLGLATAVAAALTLGLAGAGPAQADDCANAAFRTGASASLPDCRAYEQVSPVEKNGNNVVDTGSVLSIGSSGKVYYNASGSINNSETVLYDTSYLASRGGDWTTRGIDPPVGQADLILKATMGLSEDATKAVVVSSRALAPGAIEGGSNLYIRDLTQLSSYRLVVATQDDKLFNDFGKIGGQGYYLGGTDDLSAIAFSARRALTPDAGPEDPANTSTQKLYVWRDGTLEAASVDANGDPVPVQPQGNTPRRAFNPLSADGTRLTFRSYDSDPANNPITEQDYQFISGQHASPFTPPDPSGGAGNKNQDLGLSADGKYFWYLQTPPPAAPGEQEYAYLVVRDLQTGTSRRAMRFDEYVTSIPLPYGFRLSPDGHRVVVQSFSPVTGVPNQNDACQDTDRAPAGLCGNLFTYDADTPDQGPVCVSCVPASQSIGTAHVSQALSFFDGRDNHPILDDGRIFFDTPNRLVAADTNVVSDVYEYVPGSGVRLITSGTSGSPAIFGDTSPDGKDVFFTTEERLVAQDTDLLADLYSARVGGGIASQQIAPPEPGAACSGEACRPAITATPARPRPGSSVFRAPPASTAPRFSVGRLSASALRAAGRSGRLSLPVRVNVAGRVSATLSGRVSGRRTSTVARASGRARSAGTVRLSLRLSKAALAKLKRDGRLSLRLTVRFSERDGASVRTITLTTGRTASKAKGGAR